MNFEPWVIALSPNPGHVVLHVVLLTSFHRDVTTAQQLDGPFGCDVTMKKSANRCDVGPLAKGQFILNCVSSFVSFAVFNLLYRLLRKPWDIKSHSSVCLSFCHKKL